MEAGIDLATIARNIERGNEIVSTVSRAFDLLKTLDCPRFDGDSISWE